MGEGASDYEGVHGRLGPRVRNEEGCRVLEVFEDHTLVVRNTWFT